MSCCVFMNPQVKLQLHRRENVFSILQLLSGTHASMPGLEYCWEMLACGVSGLAARI